MRLKLCYFIEMMFYAIYHIFDEKIIEKRIEKEIEIDMEINSKLLKLYIKSNQL